MGPQVPDQTTAIECPGHCHKGNGVVSWALPSECPGHCPKGNGVVSWALPSECPGHYHESVSDTMKQ